MFILFALMAGFTFIYPPVADFVKSAPYKFNHLDSRVLDFVSPKTEEELSKPRLGSGSYEGGSGTIIGYSSFYDKDSHAYFYRIDNHSDGIYARSKIFLIFLGQSGIWLDGWKSTYIEVKDSNPPVYRQEWMLFSDSKYLPSGSGFGIGIIMPQEKPRHHLLLKSLR